MTPREIAQAIYTRHFHKCGGYFTAKATDKLIDEIAAALLTERESTLKLPEKKPGSNWFYDGWNACLHEIENMNCTKKDESEPVLTPPANLK